MPSRISPSRNCRAGKATTIRHRLDAGFYRAIRLCDRVRKHFTRRATTDSEISTVRRTRLSVSIGFVRADKSSSAFPSISYVSCNRATRTKIGRRTSNLPLARFQGVVYKFHGTECKSTCTWPRKVARKKSMTDTM